jgi:hypothetical protein
MYIILEKTVNNNLMGLQSTASLINKESYHIFDTKEQAYEAIKLFKEANEKSNLEYPHSMYGDTINYLLFQAEPVNYKLNLIEEQKVVSIKKYVITEEE